MMFAYDPLDIALARARDIELAHAQQRGARVLDLTDSVLSLLVAAGWMAPQFVDDARPVVFHELADDIYGNLALDIPPLRAARSRP